jgi:hypothetical protein
MRKILTLALALLLFAVPAVAQVGLPEELRDGVWGGNIPGPHSMQLYLERFDDNAPWGIPSITGSYWLFGDVKFCTDDTVVIDIDALANRWCEDIEDAPWGLPEGVEGEACYQGRERQINYPGYRIPWDENTQSYIDIWEDNEGRIHFMAFVLKFPDGDPVARFYTGRFIVAPGPTYEFDPGANLYVYNIQPRDVEYVNIARRTTGRRGR